MGWFSDIIDSVGDLGQDIIDTGKDLVSSDLGKAALIGGGLYLTGGLDGLLGEAAAGDAAGGELLSGLDLGGAGAGADTWGSGLGSAVADLGGWDAAMADLANNGGLDEVAAPTVGFADALGADNIDMGGGWNPATGAGDAATAAAAAATGTTGSAAIPYLGNAAGSTIGNLLGNVATKVGTNAVLGSLLGGNTTAAKKATGTNSNNTNNTNDQNLLDQLMTNGGGTQARSNLKPELTSDKMISVPISTISQLLGPQNNTQGILQ